MKKIFFAASLALIAFSSCKKDTAATPPATATANTVQTHQKIYTDDAANINNPYDDAGYWHNVALQETRSVWKKKNATQTDIYNAIVNYAVTTNAPYAIPDQRVVASIFNAASVDTPKKYKTYIASTNLSDQAKAYENSLMDIMYSKFASFADFKTACINLESRISADATLVGSEKQALLESASVARHSMLYWQNEMGDGNPAGSNPVLMRGFWSWLGIGAVVGGFDAIGIFAGSIIGSAILSSAWAAILLG